MKNIRYKGYFTYPEFCRYTWRMSRKIIHFKDWCNLYETELKLLYNKTIDDERARKARYSRSLITYPKKRTTI